MTTDDARISGFGPVSSPDARILILGSLPSQRSVKAFEYYAHPQNGFWPIMNRLFGIEGDYPQRCRQLTQQGIALWDVLASSVRPGSMDADIDRETALPNDFDSFFARHPGITKVCFNGRAAQDLYHKLVTAEAGTENLTFHRLPSTSPAYASLSLADKFRAWRGILKTGS